MLDSIVGSPVVLSLLCGLLAGLVVSPRYVTPYVHLGHAVPASMPARFPLRAFARAAFIAYIVLINAASLGLAHRLPLGTTLIAVGFLMLLFLPADQPRDGSASHA